MIKILTTASVLAVAASVLHAGGIDRSGQSVAVIFEEGRHLEFSIGSINPDVSGTAVAGLGGFSSGDMAPSYLQLSGAYKADLNESFSYALVIDQPFGADVSYPTGTGYFAGGSTATLNSIAATAIGQVNMANGLSAFAGVRAQSLEAEASISLVPGYTADGARDWGVGWLVGVAWERPDIAARVALTFNSEVDHSLTTVETGPVPGTTATPVTTPHSVNLEFQTGIAPETLLFGSVRYVAWSDFDISPAGYMAATGASLVSYANDTVTYSIGVGRRINENLSLALTVGHEAPQGGFASNLGPTDGNTSLGVGASYTEGATTITGGLRFIWIGDAQTAITGFAPAADFSGNTAIAIGVKVERKI